MRPTALLVADASGALGILVGVPAAELAEARSTPRATESVVASEEAQSAKFPSHPHSAALSPSPIAEIRTAEEPTPVSVVSAVSRSRAPAAEIPSETAVQSALQHLLAIFEAPRQLRPDVGLRDLRYLEDAPRDRFRWVPFVVACVLPVVARVHQPFGSERFLSRFPGLGLAPPQAQC